MKTLKYIFAIFCLTGALTACSDDTQEAAPVPENRTQSIQVSEENWTYVSLENGQVVGTSALGDEKADADWKNRQDWDIAFCRNMVRTNGGTSGNGQGGLQVVDQAYGSLTEAPADGYAVDRDDNEIWN